MGKIRVSTLGDTESEKKQKEEAAKRRLAKKEAKEGTKAAVASEEKKTTKKEVKLSKKADAVEKKEVKEEKKEEAKKEIKKAGTPKKSVPHVRGKRYIDLRKLVDPRKIYSLSEGLVLVKQTSNTKFTGTVEAHFKLNRVVKVKNIDGLKVERKTPLAHAKLGKITDTDKALQEKIETAVKALGAPNVKKLVLNASMGPGIKVNLA